jgi:MFS family permease
MKRNRNLYLFIISQFIAIIGERISTLAFITLASQANRSDSSKSTSLIGVFQIIPVIIFSFVGGYLADKYSRKNLLLIFNIIRVSTILLVLFFFNITTPPISIIYIAVIILGFITSLYNPAKKSFIPFLVEKKENEIKNGNWYLTISEIIAMVLGIGIGTYLLNFIPANELLIFDAFFFIISISLLIFLPKMKSKSFTEKSNLIKELKASIKIVKKSKPVLGLMLLLVLPFYISSGLFYAAASHWAAVISPQNTGEALGRLFFVLAIGAICSYTLKNIVDNKNDFAFIKYLFLLNSISIMFLAFFTVQQQSITYIFTFITGVFVGFLYPKTIYLFQFFVDKDNIGKITGLNEIIFGLTFVGTVISSVLFGDLFIYKIGWIINSGLLFAAFLAFQLFQKKYFAIL